MMSTSPLDQLTSRLRRRDLAVAALLALLLSAPLGVLWARTAVPVWLWVCWLALSLAIVGAWLERRRQQVRPDSLAAHLDRALPSLEDSSALLCAEPESLPVLARLQRRRLLERLETVPSGLLPWPRRALVTAALAAAVLGTVSAMVPVIEDRVGAALAPASPLQPGDLRSVRVTIEPPAYTGLPPRTVDSLDVDAEEGADLVFRLGFATAVADVRLALDDGTELHSIEPGGRVHPIRLQASDERIYRLHWRDASGDRHTDYHRLRLLRDQPPVLEVLAPQRSPEVVEPAAEPITAFVLQASDDYGIGPARILATVAKGEGEGVKFRDVELNFETVEGLDGRQQLTRRWHLPDLGMAPGDELYFRAEVEDNRAPDPNLSRTAMLMVRWESDSEAPGLSIEGIAVDLVPEYFRSQRQIIIDTEKLMAEAEQLAWEEGSRRSRNLAFDQKALRIRYGQYLGEEYSSDIGAQAAAPLLGDGHQGESFAEHQAHAGGDEHSPDEHGPVSATIESLPEFMADFVHVHDSSEQATLFDEKTRDTLKAALAAMWDAELELHLSRPEAALPHEYRALDLLKQVQQANRIYVRRVGFEPPPLDTGKQLSGDLEEALGWRNNRAAEANVPSDLHRALATVLTEDSDSRAFRAALILWRNELATDPQAIETRLLLTRLLDANESAQCSDCLARIRAVARSLLPPPPASPRTPAPTRHARVGEAYQALLKEGGR